MTGAAWQDLAAEDLLTYHCISTLWNFSASKDPLAIGALMKEASLLEAAAALMWHPHAQIVECAVSLLLNMTLFEPKRVRNCYGMCI